MADPSVVLDLILAFRRSKTMFAAVELGVFDQLESGPKQCADVAAALQCDCDALDRLLGACVGLKLLTYDCETSEYENTEVAKELLCSKSPARITGYINCSNDAFWGLWSKLEGAVKDGSNRWKEVFDWDTDKVFENLFKTEEDQEEFLMGMHGYGQITSPFVVNAFNLSSCSTLVDLGGGTGHLAIQACQKYPDLKAIVYDQPGVVPLAERMIKEAGLSDRIEVLGGDFFKDELPAGDLFAVARTLHDWSEDRVRILLQRVSERLPENGAILIAEKVLNEDRNGPDWAQMQNLNMLVLTEGRERTFAEYEFLLKDAGFGKVDMKASRSVLDAILAVKSSGEDALTPFNPTPSPIKERFTAKDVDVHKVTSVNDRAEFEIEAEGYFRFFEDAPIGFVVSRLSGEFVLVNQAFADIHGRDKKEMLQTNYKEFTPEWYGEVDAKQIEALKRDGTFGPFDKQYIRKDKKLVWVRLTLHLIKLQGEEFIWSVIEPLKEERESQQQLTKG